MLWVRTLSVFLPSLLISSVVCPRAGTAASANTLANSHAFRIVILPCSAGFLLVPPMREGTIADCEADVRRKLWGPGATRSRDSFRRPHPEEHRTVGICRLFDTSRRVRLPNPAGLMVRDAPP